MKLLKFAFFLSLLSFAAIAGAATLVCDWMPYSTDGQDYNKADLVQFSDDGGSTWTDFNVEVSADTEMFRVSEPFDPTQPVDWTVRAYNSVWSRESAHVPFTWGGEGPIVAPSGWQVVP